MRREMEMRPGRPPVRNTAGTLTGPIRETGETLRWTLQSNRKQSFHLKERPCTRKSC